MMIGYTSLEPKPIIDEKTDLDSFLLKKKKSRWQSTVCQYFLAIV